jgi:integrase/recombinase XerD
MHRASLMEAIYRTPDNVPYLELVVLYYLVSGAEHNEDQKERTMLVEHQEREMPEATSTGGAIVPNAAGAVEVIAPSTPLLRPGVPQRTLADLLAEVILRGKSPQTRRAYRADLQDFLVFLKQDITLPADPEVLRASPALIARVEPALQRLQHTTEADINAYMQHLGQALKPATISRRLTPLRLLFGRLHRYHLIAINPLDDVKAPKVSARSNTIYLSRHEARRLEEECHGQTLRDQRDLALIVVMLSTGLRSTEITRIDIEHLSIRDGHRVVQITGKGNQTALIKLKPRAWDVLERYLQMLQSEGVSRGALFRRLRHCAADPNLLNAPRRYTIHGRLTYDGLKYILQTRFTAAGLHLKLQAASSTVAGRKLTTADRARQTNVTPHGLRHSFVTLALKGGASLTKVQEAARHADPKTTMRYAHDQNSLDDNAVDYVNW